MPTYTWICACGAFEAALSGAPLLNFTCHCHSCVAPSRYLSAAHASSRSALDQGGVAKAFYALSAMSLPPPGDADLSFLKVGAAGENVRSYTSCCGTLFNTAGGKNFPVPVRPISRKGIRVDGEDYAPEGEVTHCLTKYKFGDYEAPAASFEGGSPALGEAFKAFGAVEKPAVVDARWEKTGQEVDEIVPITWEGGDAAGH